MRKSLFYSFFLICAMISHQVDSQGQSSFQYKSTLSDITSAGFYKIILSPAIVAKSKNDLNDVRLLNGKGNQVPYILRSDKPEFNERSFIEYPILSIKKEADKQTHIIIQNKTNSAIDELLLVIKNTDAERTITLSGSDDQKQWFVIKEHISLSNIFVRERDRFVQSLNFPNSSYKFFDLIINGKDLLPVNIIKVGIYEGVLRNGEFVSIPAPTIIQKDSSDKLSYISLIFDESYLVNKLQLNVQGPKFFRRPLTIYNNENFGYPLNNYVLSSGIETSYAVDVKAQKIGLVIENQDNPPVKIQSVKAYQLNRYLLTYLEPANKYELVFGDSTANAPKYDLEFFKDSLNNSAALINSGSIIKIEKVQNKTTPAGNKSMLTLWIIIVAVLALLLILTFRMTKEIGRKENER